MKNWMSKTRQRAGLAGLRMLPAQATRAAPPRKHLFNALVTWETVYGRLSTPITGTKGSGAIPIAGSEQKEARP